jgi:hypothetical protein
MNTFRLIILTLLCGLFASSAFAQSSQEMKFWKKAVAEKSLSQLASLLTDTSTPAWPKAGSPYSIQKLAGEPRALADDAIALVKALHAKAQREFNRTTQGANDEPRTYSTLASALERSGGYSNMLLADSFRRLALFRLSAAVVRGSRPAADVRREVEQIAVPHVEIRGLLERLAADDEALNGNASELGKITPDQNVYAALQASGLGDPSSLSGRPFGQLIENPSAVALMLRMAGTELLYTISLNGLLSFLEKGGTYAELNPADMTAFKARMGGSTKSFQYPPLGVRSLSVSHPRSLFELHNELGGRDAFLNVALE